jgi:3-methyl-2-oxobutanoate hydroxymethyltransferase
MTVGKIMSLKNREKIVMLTAYDTLTARILNELQIDIILVGDSLGEVYAGYKSTLPVTMDEMIYHVKAVRRGAPNSFIIADMPFLSYGTSAEESVRNAGRFLKEAAADAVKLEGGSALAPVISAITTVGIPVMGHIGLKPQSIKRFGRKIMGKNPGETEELIIDAMAIKDAGAFAFVIEGTTEESAREITERISIPTIGIGAGRYTDGQVLVITDMLGMDKDTNLKHNKKYADLYGAIRSAVISYSEEVKKGVFPSEGQVFHREA